MRLCAAGWLLFQGWAWWGLSSLGWWLACLGLGCSAEGLGSLGLARILPGSLGFGRARLGPAGLDLAACCLLCQVNGFGYPVSIGPMPGVQRETTRSHRCLPLTY